MFSMLSNTNCFASPGRFEKSLTDSSGHGALCRLGPFGTESVSPCATVYGSPTPRQYFRYIDTISVCGVRRNPLRTYIQKNQLCRNLSNVPQAPAGSADERESAWSEGRLAGASERLFVGLPQPRNSCYNLCQNAEYS